MFVLRALMYGLTGGYLALALLLAAAVLSKARDPQAMAAFLDEASWLPGAAQIQMTLIKAGSGQGAQIAPAPEAELSELQKLRARTYGDATAPGPTVPQD